MAHMLARLVYRMLTFGHEYVDRGIEFYETKYRQQQVQWVTKQAAAPNATCSTHDSYSLSFWRVVDNPPGASGRIRGISI
jgi:mannose/cellobiose epimerase-like protein (N-acyl-D-glucosamine 2-epimerase family)